LKLRKAKPSLIRWPEERVTSVFDEETRNLLTALIKEMGLIAPIIVQEIDGELVGVDGYHRCEDAIRLGDAQIDVAVIEGDMVDLLCRNLVMDRARGKHTPSQMVRLLKTLSEKYGLDSDAIQKRTGLTRDYIERLLKISTASPSVQEALDKEIIGIGHAYELARLPYALQQDEIIAKHQVYRFSVKELHEQIDQVLVQMEMIKTAPPDQVDRAQRPPPVYNCEGCKDVVEPRYLRPVMLCPNCFGEVWRLGKARAAPEAKAEEKTGRG
jgi:ParB family chromosome partitioning protein